MSNIFIEYLKLARLHSSILTGLTPVLGALAVGYFELINLLILFIIGICTHIFGFVFNEYMDIEIDKKAEHLSDKPLVSGIISPSAALTYAFSAVIFGYLLTGYLILNINSIGLLVIILYTISWLSIAVYDLTSKSIRGSDLALAIWTGSLVLFGGFAVINAPSYLLLIISGLAFLQLLIQNILAGLKDIKQDKLGMGTTTPLRFGVHVKGLQLVVPFKFQILIYFLKFIHFLVIFIPFLVYWLVINLIQLFFILIFLIIIFYITFSIFNTPQFDRKTLLRKIGLHEIISYAIVPIMLYGLIDLMEILFLIFIPILWLAFFMKMIYGKLLPTI